VAPHIDLARGEDGYAAAYRWLAARAPADLYVVFGTGHAGPAAPLLTGLAMDWETPLGVVRTDRDVVAAVHATLGPADPRDTLLHRDEHSLEFQMLMLRHVLGERPFAVAGFLCGQLPSSDGDPGGEEYVSALIGAFRSAVAGRRVCFVAGADLAHVGPFFGDPDAVDAATLARIGADDRARLDHVVAGVPGGFHRAVEGDGNPDRICGTAPIFLVGLLAGGTAELLHYGQARADDGSQVVTFASLGFDGPAPS
jgi:AmmeMemoRadiSam system protein B